MKLMSFEQRGRQAWGVVRGEEVVDLSGVWPDLRTALEDGAGRIAQRPVAPACPVRPWRGNGCRPCPTRARSCAWA